MTSREKKRPFDISVVERDMIRKDFVAALTAPKPAVNKELLATDLAILIDTAPFNDEDIVKLYKAIIKRLRAVKCYICEKPMPMQETKIVYKQGGPRRICEKCGDFLIE